MDEVGGGHVEVAGQAQDGSIWWGSSGPKSWVHRVDGETVTDF
jgi:hypothetical protein